MKNIMKLYRHLNSQSYLKQEGRDMQKQNTHGTRNEKPRLLFLAITHFFISISQFFQR